MSFKPIPTKIWKRFLISRGLVHIRSKGDHEIWDYPKNSHLLRPVTFIGCDKEIPSKHIQTNLRTLGISNKDFLKEIS